MDKRLKLEKPLAFIDLETTGLDIARDRIISIAILILYPKEYTDLKHNPLINERDYPTRQMYTLVNPMMPIPQEATDVNGITNEAVTEPSVPTFNKIASGINEMLQGCDLAGFNCIDFDIPVLSEEMLRCGITFPEPNAKIIDPCIIFKKKESRDLASAVKFYCNREHSGAHHAAYDALATSNILFEQSEMYSDLSTVEELAEFSKKDTRVDLAGKIIRDTDGDYAYNFGKDRGKKIKNEPSFAHWMMTQPFITRNTKMVLERIFDEVGIQKQLF